MTDPDYYPIAFLTIERRLVWLRLYGQDIKGDMRRNKRGDRVLRIIGEDGRTLERAANHVQRDVSLWRPFDHDLASWPEPLPAPAVLMTPPAPPRPTRRPFRVRPAGDIPDSHAIRRMVTGERTAWGYSAPGSISLEECESRLLRAFIYDRNMPDRDKAKLKVRANWPATGYEPGDYPPGIDLKWQPFEEDIEDYLTAMAWVSALAAHQIKIVRARARGWGFLRISEEVKPGGRRYSDEWINREYVAGLVEAWKRANGGDVSSDAARRSASGPRSAEGARAGCEWASEGARTDGLAEAHARPLVPAGG